jgi:hypothetical protein
MSQISRVQYNSARQCELVHTGLVSYGGVETLEEDGLGPDGASLRLLLIAAD